MRLLKNRTIFTIILVSCLLSLTIPFILLSYFATALLHNESAATARKNAVLVSDSVSKSIKYSLTNTTELISFAADALAALDPQDPGSAPRASNILNTFIYTDDGIYDAWFIFEKGVYGDEYFAQDFIREDGKVIPFVDNTEERLADEKGAHWYYRPLRSGQIYFDNEGSYDYGEGDVDVFTISTPIKRDGKIVGVIGMDIMRRHYYRVISDFRITGEREILMLSQKGKVLYSPDESQDEKSIFINAGADKERILNIIASNKNSVVEGISPLTGKPSLVYIKPLDLPNAQQPAYLYLEMSSDILYANANKIMWTIILAAVIAGGLLFVGVFYSTKNIVGILKELTAAANDVAKGNYNVKFGSDFTGKENTHNELFLLQRSLKTMIVQLKNYIKERQEFSNTLEQKIEERTQALTLMTAESEKAKQKAEEASRAKSDFLARMSHEIRTPINAIMGMTAIGKNAKDIEKKDYCFGKIDNASSHLLGIINDILDMSKIEANKLELSFAAFDFSGMIAKVTDLIKVKVDEKKQTLTVNLDEGIAPYIISDEQHLSQVVFNLLSNAVKFTPDGGNISIHVSQQSAGAGKVALKVEVRDSGIGIAKEQQSALFQSFQQADSSISRKFGGTGLGLAISKHIIKMLEGEIWVDSAAGQGSVFSFVFKAKVAEGAAAAAQPAAPSTASFKGKKLLLVEDIEINREIVISLLEDTGIIIDTADNGTDAVDKVALAPGAYDMIFMDIHMPGIDGYEATRQIRALPASEAKTVPIVAMTANVFRDDIEKSIAAGMNAHLGKPINIEEVKKVLAQYLLK
ncbi:signal transduction histidine kinase/ActR/RegA family two-component response regulator [Elusimicrobium simillimum]|uniref:hybrid sensor histidine kinase/response regulator n=1 Tax=Elusimicrobium simillimum TaxID=3143438 RepID=UPI003C6F70B5